MACSAGNSPRASAASATSGRRPSTSSNNTRRTRPVSVSGLQSDRGPDLEGSYYLFRGNEPEKTDRPDTITGAGPATPSGRPDLNRGPPAPEAGALTGLRYAPLISGRQGLPWRSRA